MEDNILTSKLSCKKYIASQILYRGTSSKRICKDLKYQREIIKIKGKENEKTQNL
jgi:hypothetical protein